MVFDAAALWWPPFARLYTQLETLKLEPSAVSADALKAALAGGRPAGMAGSHTGGSAPGWVLVPGCMQAWPPANADLPPPPAHAEYEPWLAKGPGGFRPPSEASRRALEGEAALSIGAKKLPVEAGLRAAALDVSRTLGLDEVQAYVLLRRWVAKAGPQALRPGGGGGAAPASLTPAQRLDVAQMYWGERLQLLKCIEDLLWEGEREWAAAAGALRRAVLGGAGRAGLYFCSAGCCAGLCSAACCRWRHGPAAAHSPQPPLLRSTLCSCRRGGRPAAGCD